MSRFGKAGEVLDRAIDRKGYYPPISILPSLSRLMKDGVGEGFTRADHPELANQLFASYAKVQDARALASVIGEEDLSPIDKLYINFGKAFEKQFINQGFNENRPIEESLELGWRLLSSLPRSELDRVSDETLNKYYIEDKELLERKNKADLIKLSVEDEDTDDDIDDIEDTEN